MPSPTAVRDVAVRIPAGRAPRRRVSLRGARDDKSLNGIYIEGHKRAMQNGVRFGRKPKLSDFQRKEAAARRGNGETLAQIARLVCRQCEYDLAAVAEADMANRTRVRGLLGPAALGSKTSNSKKDQT